MGNQSSSSKNSSNRRKSNSGVAQEAAQRAKKVIGDLNEEIKKSVKKLDDDHPASVLIDTVCGAGFFNQESSKYYNHRTDSYYTEDGASEDGSRTYADDDTYGDDRTRNTVDSASYMSQTTDGERSRRKRNSFDTEDESKVTSTTVDNNVNGAGPLLSKPLASSFAKRCYFTKAGIGKTTQHYEGLTLTGNVVLMLAAAMKLKGCPTICDEDLRRVEQTYPNQFSRLPDELLLSSGWRRISKYCHFSNKPIPDGVPFFHSKQRLHPNGGYYFLLAASVGMVRPLDVEPLTKDTLVLLETDFPSQCDATPQALIQDPDAWTLVNKFCFFSGGPINTEEDVFYQADFDGNLIYMLAFLSPSLSANELYKLQQHKNLQSQDGPGLKSVKAVQEVESVYDLTERDFDDLKLYHLGPCRALPPYILLPSAWTKVLPPHFLAARQHAMLQAEDWELRHGGGGGGGPTISDQHPTTTTTIVNDHPQQQPPPPQDIDEEEEGGDAYFQENNNNATTNNNPDEFKRQIEEEGAFHNSASEHSGGGGNNRYPVSPPGKTGMEQDDPNQEVGAYAGDPATPRMDPPDDEPPSLMKGSMEEAVRSRNFGGGSTIQDEQTQFYSLNGMDSSQQQHHDYTDVPDPEDPVLSPSVSAHRFFEDGEFGEGQEQVLDGCPPNNNNNNVDPNYQQTPQDHHPYVVGGGGDEYDGEFGAEEKKMGYEDPDHQQHPDIAYQMSDVSNLEDGEGDFMPIKRDGYSLGRPKSSSAMLPVSPTESHQSAALRSAQDLLKKNRRRRMEMAANKSKSHEEEEEEPEPFHEEEPNPAISPSGTWDSGSELSASVVSGTSSAWTNDTGTDQSSRRALILQMAKARMKNNKSSSPDKSKASGHQQPPTVLEEEPSIQQQQQQDFVDDGFGMIDMDNLTAGNTDIDFSVDLD